MHVENIKTSQTISIAIKGMVSTLFFFNLNVLNREYIKNINEYQIDRFENVKSTFLYLFRKNVTQKSFRSSHYALQISVTHLH